MRRPSPLTMTINTITDMKKNLMKTMVAVAALSLAMTSCNKSTANDEAQAQPVAPGSLKIA